ncbi:MAG: phosphoribosylglycinamide formyltransferase [Melioribacteraceae bacterium]|nr:phosphoribosylglycinamide formyltransferase [Melioribacteraceae bacterium]
MTNGFKITVLASGGGGNFQALINNQSKVGYTINLLIVDRECGSTKRAKKHGIDYKLIDREKMGANFADILLDSIPSDTNLIVLAGFLSILDHKFCLTWKNRIINIHPSLLPKYGGKGMFGVKVHEAVMEAKEQYSGCTVHFVDEKIDNGKILLQHVVKVDYNESPWELGGRIYKEENRILVEAVKIIMEHENLFEINPKPVCE